VGQRIATRTEKSTTRASISVRRKGSHREPERHIYVSIAGKSLSEKTNTSINATKASQSSNSSSANNVNVVS
jgi:hypothetical protein